MAPDFCPYHGDIGEISKYFSNCDTRNGARALQPEGLKTVSGRIRDILIDETKDGDIAIIHLAERDDYGQVIFPDLFETYKRMILKEDYLEYNGIPQECFVTGNSSETMIFVTTIDIPTLTDEMEDNDHEQ